MGWSERRWPGRERQTPVEILLEAAALVPGAAKCAVAAAAVPGMGLGREKLSPGMGNVVVAPEAVQWDGDIRDVLGGHSPEEPQSADQDMHDGHSLQLPAPLRSRK